MWTAVWLMVGCAGAPLDSGETDLQDSEVQETDVESQTVSGDRFVEDLRAELADWYVVHEADVANSGAQTLEDAQAAVTVDTVLDVPGEQEDPFGYDLSTHTVYAHPDVVWPGSDIVWFGAYLNSDGSLVEIVSFN